MKKSALKARLKHSRKRMLQRKNKPLKKHADETLAKATPAPAPVVATPPPPPEPKWANVQVNAKYLRAMRHVAAKQDIRYYLNGVHLSATKEDGRLYVATDGHKLAVIREPWRKEEEPQEFSLIIPRAVCERATPLLKKSDVAMLKQVDAWTWTLHGGGEIQQTFKAIDGKFPEWRRVIPTTLSGAPGFYNWQYMYSFDQLAKEAFGSVWSTSLKQNGEGAALVTNGSSDFLGVIMPMRDCGGPVPPWVADVQKENAARKEQERLEQEARERAAQPAEAAA